MGLEELRALHQVTVNRVAEAAIRDHVKLMTGDCNAPDRVEVELSDDESGIGQDEIAISPFAEQDKGRDLFDMEFVCELHLASHSK